MSGSAQSEARRLGVSTDAVELFRASDVFDLHVDSFIWTRVFGYDLKARHDLGRFDGRWYSQLDIPRAVDSLSGAVWSLTTNPFRSRAGRRRALFRNLKRLKTDLVSHPDVALVRSRAEYQAARAARKHAALLGIQGANAVYDLDDLDRLPLRDFVRVTLLGFTHSSFGEASETIPKRYPSPGSALTGHGVELIERLNSARVLVDLSHISRAGFERAVEVHDSTQPLVVSHAGVDAVYPHVRNLTDRQLRQVADTGGTVGIIFKRGLLGRRDALISAHHVVDHLQHIVDTVGDRHASLGADWDGVNIPPVDLRTPSQLPRLVQVMLDRGFSDTTIQRILGRNVLSVLDHLRPA